MAETSALDPLASRFHTIMEQSLLPVTMKPGANGSSISQSLSNFKQRTLPVWRLKEANSFPVSNDQTLMVLSREPVIMRLESNSRQYTLR
jgi:hypothetical protein